MKMKVEFDDCDELDALAADLARMAHEAASDEKAGDALVLVSILDKLLNGEIVEA